MKSLSKLIPGFILAILSFTTVKSQILSENFNAGLPVSWTQSPTATWSVGAGLGTSGSDCVMAEDLTMTIPTFILRTPTLNLTAVTNLTVSFKLALIGNNFIVPNLALSYDAGAGSQFLARWGSGFSTNTTYTVTTNNYDYQPPLDAQNVTFVSSTHSVSAISGAALRFIFEAEFVNGGYVVIDDIVITGVTGATTGLEQLEENNSIIIFPNPSVNKKVMLQGKGIQNLFVTDNLGKALTVAHIKINEMSNVVDLSALPTGIYYVNVIAEDKVPVRKKIILE